MSFMNVQTSGWEGIEVSYRPAHDTDGHRYPAWVHVEFVGNDYGYLSLTVEDARSLLEQLPLVLAEHDAAEHGEPPDVKAVA